MKGEGLGRVMVTPVPGMNNQWMAASFKESSGHREEVVGGRELWFLFGHTHLSTRKAPELGGKCLREGRDAAERRQAFLENPDGIIWQQ